MWKRWRTVVKRELWLSVAACWRIIMTCAPCRAIYGHLLPIMRYKPQRSQEITGHGTSDSIRQCEIHVGVRRLDATCPGAVCGLIWILNITNFGFYGLNLCYPIGKMSVFWAAITVRFHSTSGTLINSPSCLNAISWRQDNFKMQTPHLSIALLSNKNQKSHSSNTYPTLPKSGKKVTNILFQKHCWKNC